MSTPAQIEANRANAQLSTGPRTEDGKRASAANATREGLTSARLIVRPGEEAHYEAMRANLTKELEPEGEFQTQCFEVIVHAAWNIQRCIVLEGELQLQAFEKGSLDAMLDDEIAVKLDRLYRYKKMHENSQRKAVAQLGRLQSEAIYRGYQHPAMMDSKILLDSAKVDANVAAAQKEKMVLPPQPATAQPNDEDSLQNEATIPAGIATLIDPPGTDPRVAMVRRQLQEMFRQQQATAAATQTAKAA